MDNIEKIKDNSLDKNGMIKSCPYDKEDLGRCHKPKWVKEKCSCYLLPYNSGARSSILYR